MPIAILPSMEVHDAAISSTDDQATAPLRLRPAPPPRLPLMQKLRQQLPRRRLAGGLEDLPHVAAVVAAVGGHVQQDLLAGHRAGVAVGEGEVQRF